MMIIKLTTRVVASITVDDDNKNNDNGDGILDYVDDGNINGTMLKTRMPSKAKKQAPYWIMMTVKHHIQNDTTSTTITVLRNFSSFRSHKIQFCLTPKYNYFLYLFCLQLFPSYDSNLTDNCKNFDFKYQSKLYGTAHHFENLSGKSTVSVIKPDIYKSTVIQNQHRVFHIPCRTTRTPTFVN